MYNATKSLSIIALLFSLGMVSCAGPGTPSQGDRAIDLAGHLGDPELYVLRPGDKLRLFSTVMPAPSDGIPYKIEMGDVVDVFVQDRAELSRNYVVPPDGIIQFALLEPLPVQGKSVDELRQMLKSQYQPYIGQNRLSVTLAEFQFAAKNLVSNLMKQGSTMPSYETIIEADGSANFPVVGFVTLRGLTMREANTKLQAQYDSVVSGLRLSLNVAGSRGHSLTVLGEVRLPGAVELQGSISLAAALGSVGGYTSYAKTSSLIIIQQRQGKILVNRFDLDKDLVLSSQVHLRPGDVVFVPRTFIGDMNLFVDTYIRKNLPIQVGTGLNLNYDLNR